LKKYLFLILVLVLVFPFSSMCSAIDRDKPPALPNNISMGTAQDYVERMIENIRYYIDLGYYNEATYLLKDLNAANQAGLNQTAISELQNKLNGLYSPEKENSFYNSDVLVKAKDFTGKYGYIDSTGKFVIEAKYDTAEEFSDGMAWVRIKGEGCFINRNGDTSIQFKPEQKTEIKSSFNSGLALCEISGSETHEDGYIYIDKQGNEQIFLPKYGKFSICYEPGRFSEGFAVVKDVETRLYGYIDTDGKWLVKPTFAKAFAFRNQMAAVMYPNSKVFGFINNTGKPAFRPAAKDTWNYNDEIALIKTTDDFLKYIDKSGNVVYDSNTEVIDKKPCGKSVNGERSDGLIAMTAWEGISDNDNHAILFIGKDNHKKLALVEKRIINNHFNVYDEDQAVFSFANGRAFIKTKYYGWAMIDLKGNFVVKPQNEWKPESRFHNGLAKVKYKDGSLGYINRDGKVVYKE
jgi:hypothetical protein